jgi:hypothetical protein
MNWLSALTLRRHLEVRLLWPMSDTDRRKEQAMVHLDFEDKEADLMKEILESYLFELTDEIGKTDKFSFREDLKDKRTFVKDMISKIEHKAA